MITKAHHRRVSKVRSSIPRLNGRLKKKYQKFKEDKKALKSFQTGYKLSILYLLVVRPAQAVDTFEQFLEKAQELQQVFNETTPVEAVGKLAALKNWLQKLNLSDFRQCFTTLGMGQLIGCSLYYLLSFVSAVLSYKLFKYWKLKQDLDDYTLIYLRQYNLAIQKVTYS